MPDEHVPTEPSDLRRAAPILLATMEARPTVLLVDDEESVQKVLTYPLEREGYRVVQARDGEEALERYRVEPVDLVILDLMLPRLDGLAVCRRLREERSAVPIIMLTARGDEGDKVLGLELGADDYITKPFSIREFMSRVRALLRRAQLPASSEREDVVEVDGVRIDTARRTVEARGTLVQLTYLEFELLRMLATNPGRVFTRKALLDELWGGSEYRDPRTIDVHVRHLREKLERDPSEPELIFTVRGAGYRFRDVR
jgi:DNA-binding response OmpR family regulator